MEDHPHLPDFPSVEEGWDAAGNIADGIEDLAAATGHALNSGYHGLMSLGHAVLGDGVSDPDAQEHLHEAVQHELNSEQALDDAWDELF